MNFDGKFQEWDVQNVNLETEKALSSVKNAVLVDGWINMRKNATSITEITQ